MATTPHPWQDCSPVPDADSLRVTTPHPWQDCSPVVLTAPDVDETDSRRVQAALDAAFVALSDRQREAFHEFCCLGQAGPEHVRVMELLRQAMLEVAP